MKRYSVLWLIAAVILVSTAQAQRRKLKPASERTRVSNTLNVSEVRIFFRNDPATGDYVLSFVEGTVLEGEVVEEDTPVNPLGPTPPPEPETIQVFKVHGEGSIQLDADALTITEKNGATRLMEAVIRAFASQQGLDLEPEASGPRRGGVRAKN